MHHLTILLMIDGFRADYFDRKITPTLQSFVNSGVAPDYMTPVFPTVTFPNQWSIATGLYPESHGIVGNIFSDPEFGQVFDYRKSEVISEPKWWGGEPIWKTVESKGLKSAVIMWPGSDVEGHKPSYLVPFDKTVTPEQKADQVFEWLDLPEEERPEFIAVYVQNVDEKSHRYGSTSEQVREAMKDVDSMLYKLLMGLEKRNLANDANIVIVSDHGMTDTSKERIIYLDDIVNLEEIKKIEGVPLAGIRPKNDKEIKKIKEIYDHIILKRGEEIEKLLPGEILPWNVYLRDKDMPERWHYSKNERIAPIVIVPDSGWTLIKEKDHPRGSEVKITPIGTHGYDNADEMMRGIFAARGPAFQHLHGKGRQWLALDRLTGKIKKDDVETTKGEVKGTRVEPFESIEVFSLLCTCFDITNPEGTNATMTKLTPINPPMTELMAIDEDGSVGKSKET